MPGGNNCYLKCRICATSPQHPNPWHQNCLPYRINFVTLDGIYPTMRKIVSLTFLALFTLFLPNPEKKRGQLS